MHLRRVILTVLASALISIFAGADKPSPPPVGKVELHLEERAGRVVLTPAADLQNVTLEIYGLDGLKVGRDGLIWVRLNALKKEQRIEIPFTMEPVAGQSSLVAIARAGQRMSMETRVLGSLSEEQERRNQACRQRDSEGNWIVITGCKEAGLPAAVPQLHPVRTATLVSLPEGLADGADLRVDGDRIEITTAVPFWIEPGCVRSGALAGSLAESNNTRYSRWTVFRDSQCSNEAILQVTIEY